MDGHVKRRDEGHVLRRMLDAPAPGKRRIGRQKTRWKDSSKRDVEGVWLNEEDTLDRTKWKTFITIPAASDYGKCPEKKKSDDYVRQRASSLH